MKHQSKWLIGVLVVLFIGLNAAVCENEAKGDVLQQPVADVTFNSDSFHFLPKVGYKHLVIDVAAPDGTVTTKTVGAGSSAFFALSDFKEGQCLDGKYTYELLAVSEMARGVRKPGMEFPGPVLAEPLRQTGYFTIRDGAIVNSAQKDGIAKTMDEVILDDLIVDGSLCVGNDCYSGYAFGFDTIVLMENNLRIFFDDTSNTSSFPNNDWRIVINDTTDGGGAYYAIQDTTNGKTPFTIEADAKTNSLYVDDDGQVGIGTSGPVFELHIKEGDTPTVRLQQDTSYGWPEQIWDIGGNETSFFIRDGTHAARLPFRIEPETPSSTLCLKSDGKVGVGTWSPGYTFEVETTGTGAQMVAQRTDGATMEFSASGSYGIAGTKTNHPVRLRVNDTMIMQLNGSGDYIEMSDGGTYDGTWNDSSSRAFKDNIRHLRADEAVEAFKALSPVKFNYKANTEEERVGFIAEDVPELVARKNKKNLSPMDIVAVLTKVVQQQQDTIKKLEQRVARLEKK